MISLSSAVTVSIANLLYAALIYLSLHGWLVVHEPSGMQLLMHLFITAPVVFITSMWFHYLSEQGKCSAIFWKLNLVGILIPILSVQKGVTYYHFDKVGLAVSLLVAAGILALSIVEFRQRGQS